MLMPESALQLVSRPDGFAELTIDQPGSRANILTRALWDELHAVLVTLTTDAACRGLILRSGKPNIFIAGADLKYLGSVPAPDDPGVRELMEFGLATLDLLENLPFPTCAVIDGAALGGGLEVTLACDYRVVGTNPSIELGLPEVKLGLIPGWGGTQRLPRLIPVTTAADMLMTGDSITATDAIRCGLVDGKLATMALETLLESGQHALRRATKRNPVPEAGRSTLTLYPTLPAVREALPVMALGTSLPLAEGLKLETAAFVKLAGSDDSRQRIAAFFANRKK